MRTEMRLARTAAREEAALQPYRRVRDEIRAAVLGLPGLLSRRRGRRAAGPTARSPHGGPKA